jgi:hypothetical protein
VYSNSGLSCQPLSTFVNLDATLTASSNWRQIGPLDIKLTALLEMFSRQTQFGPRANLNTKDACCR